MHHFSSTIYRFFWAPIRAGLIGFSVFFSALLITRVMGYLLGANKFFTVDMNDVTLSTVGFGLLFILRELENFKAKHG